MAVNDHALVVGINRYPGLSDLQGPVDDANRFADWLINTPGVDVPEANVSKLLTNNFHPPGPNSFVDARPTASDFLGHFTQVLERQFESNQGQPGRRLYLYLSGHGFQGPTLHDIAVYSAMAVRKLNSYDHIAGTRYAESIRQKGWFEEVVLIMDCCRDLELTKIIADPALPLRASAAAASKRVYRAFASSYGEKAQEAMLSTGACGGVFTHLFLKALTSTPSDTNGDVTSKSLTDFFYNLWDREPLAKGLSRPEIPGGTEVDLVWYTRPHGTAQSLADVTISAPGVDDGAQITFQTGPSPLRQISQATVTSERCATKLPPGLYKATLVGTARSKVFEVTQEGANERL